MVDLTLKIALHMLTCRLRERGRQCKFLRLWSPAAPPDGTQIYVRIPYRMRLMLRRATLFLSWNQELIAILNGLLLILHIGKNCINKLLRSIHKSICLFVEALIIVLLNLYFSLMAAVAFKLNHQSEFTWKISRLWALA